jgi:hypothetical protein
MGNLHTAAGKKRAGIAGALIGTAGLSAQIISVPAPI